jgi:hypothetical protein
VSEPQPRGPGIRGLVPGAGDLALSDGSILPGLRWLHWFRVRLVEDEPAGRPGCLLLTGCVLPCRDWGEARPSHELELLVREPAELVVARGDPQLHDDEDGEPAGMPAAGTPDPVLVALRAAPPTVPPDLPSVAARALAYPDERPRPDLPTTSTPTPPSLPRRKPSPYPPAAPPESRWSSQTR